MLCIRWRPCKTGLLKICRIWRNHVTQVWTITYSVVCRTSSSFEQQIAIFSSYGQCAWVVLPSVSPSVKKLYDVCSVHLGLLQVWITGYRGFLLEAIGLFVGKAELYFLFRATNCRFPSWGLQLKLHKEQDLHVICAGKSLVSAVSTLQPPLCITFIPMKMNLPFCCLAVYRQVMLFVLHSCSWLVRFAEHWKLGNLVK